MSELGSESHIVDVVEQDASWTWTWTCSCGMSNDRDGKMDRAWAEKMAKQHQFDADHSDADTGVGMEGASDEVQHALFLLRWALVNSEASTEKITRWLQFYGLAPIENVFESRLIRDRARRGSGPYRYGRS